MILLVGGGGVGPSSNIDEWDLVPEESVEDINMEIGHEDDDPFFIGALFGDTYNENNESAQISIPSQMGTEDHDLAKEQRKINKVVKRWKPEWVDTHKWAYVVDIEGTKKIFCSVCEEYSRVTKKTRFGNEGSKNLQLSALTEHSNSLVHKKAMDEWDLVPEKWTEDVNMEIGHEDDDPFSVDALFGDTYNENDESAQISIPSQMGIEDQDLSEKKRKINKAVKRWKPEWADSHKWAYVVDIEGTQKMFCSVCKEYGHETKKNPFRNEGSTNMQWSALVDHGNSMQHKKALRQLQSASNAIETPLNVKGSNMSCTPEAVEVLRNGNSIIAPAIAAGTGGEAMWETYQNIVKTADDFGYLNQSPEAMVDGETIAAFLDIANTMSAQEYL